MLADTVAAPGKTREVAASLAVVDPNRALSALALAGVVLGPLAFLAYLVAHVQPGILGIHAFLGGLALLRFVQSRTLAPQRRRSDVRFGAEGVVDGARVIPRSAIREGFYQPRVATKPGALGPTVRLLGRGRRVLFEAEVESEDQALELLGALGLDPSRRRARFRRASPLVATVPRQLALFGTLWIAMALIGAAHAATGLALLPLFAAMALPAGIEIGVDGVLLTWLWRKRFVPMGEILEIQSEDDRLLLLTLRSGEVVRVYTGIPRRSQGGSGAAHHQAILARIVEARRLFREGGAALDAAALVGRQGRSRADWLQALARVAGGEGGYREAAVRLENLVALVEDPRAPADARAGAAAVLHAKGDDEARARVRVAAEATASPKLRVALDAAGKDDPEAVRRALAELAEDEASEAEQAPARETPRDRA